MANVTFIIGNGLDLSLGLKTSYRDFYGYVQRQSLHPENRIYKAIEESPGTWADFELALGKYTDYIGKRPEKDRKQESEKFHDELEELRDDLAQYIQAQEQSIAVTANDVVLSHNGFSAGLPIGQKQRIDTIIARSQTRFQFVTLNYTKTLEAILANSRQGLRNFAISFSDPHHIHGDLEENLTLGVSDESQLSPSMSRAEKDDLIKPSLIYSMNDGRIDTLIQTIQTSSIMVLFGASIGETDKYIWQEITKWLASSHDHHLIIHRHDNTYTDSVRRSSRRQKQFIASAQEKILRFSGEDGDAIAELKNQILVIHNSKQLFVTR